MTDLTLAGLRVVLEVARTGSFSATAERLGYTQSAVSRQVAATEKAVGTPLFERHARGTRPTPAGEALARHAGKVLDEIAAATQELAGMRDRLAGRLVVAGFPTATANATNRPFMHSTVRLRCSQPRWRAALGSPEKLAGLRIKPDVRDGRVLFEVADRGRAGDQKHLWPQVRPAGLAPGVDSAP